MPNPGHTIATIDRGHLQLIAIIISTNPQAVDLRTIQMKRSIGHDIFSQGSIPPMMVILPMSAHPHLIIMQNMDDLVIVGRDTLCLLNGRGQGMRMLGRRKRAIHPQETSTFIPSRHRQIAEAVAVREKLEIPTARSS